MRFNHKSGGSRLAVALVAVGLTATACGGGGESGGSGGSDGGKEYAQGVTDDTIKIGMFAPLSGPSAVYGKGNHTIEAMYKKINENGGINGRQIELVIEDDKCDPTTGRLAVTKLIKQDKVFMLQGGMCSGVVNAVLPLVEQSGIPLLVTGAASSAITTPPKKNVFHGWVDESSGTAMNAQLLLDFLKETGSTKVGLMALSNEWGQGWLRSFKKSLEEAAGGNMPDIVVEGELAPDLTDATAQVQQLKNADVDVAVVYAYPDPMSVFLRTANQQGLDVPIITGQGTFPEDQLDRTGSRAAVENFFAAYCMAAPLLSDELAPYRDAVKKYYPDDVFDLSSMLGVSGVDVNASVLEQLGDKITWENWIATMEKVKNFETAAAPAPISYKPFDPADRTSRLGVASCKASHVNPDPTSKETTVVFEPDWAKWKDLQAAG